MHHLTHQWGRKKLLLSLILLYLFVGKSGFSINPGITDTFFVNTAPERYTNLVFGFNSPRFRDFATSPLFYRGLGLYLATDACKTSEKHERLLGIGFSVNYLNSNTPRSNYLQSYSGSTLLQFDIRYLRLWKLNRLSNTTYNIKIGAMARLDQNYRSNPYLLNNAIGLEKIGNLMFSSQLIRDISRSKTRQINMLLFKIHRKPVTRKLRFRLDLGILNFNHRPDYAYAYVQEIDEEESGALSSFLKNYRWSLNGWRINTELEIIKHKPNGDLHSWAYVWGAANAPGQYESFQMASHQLKYTHYFRKIKKK